LSNCDNKEIHAPWLIAPLKLQSMDIEIGKHYPAPIIEHAAQREHALALYKAASNASKPQ
jgi:deoxyribodipyrimidine photo-lyase